MVGYISVDYLQSFINKLTSHEERFNKERFDKERFNKEKFNKERCNSTHIIEP